MVSNAEVGILLGVLLVSGAYVLPTVVSTFSGSHTMEKGGDVLGIVCEQCHSYIFSELNATPLSRAVWSSHTPDKPYPQSSCMFCHNYVDDRVSGTHSKVTVIPCTYCHGNVTDSGAISDFFPETAEVGKKLANQSDAHSTWFIRMEDSYTEYVNTNDTNFTAGFYTCLVCHTHIGMNYRITRPAAINLKMNSTQTGWSSEIYINYSSNVTSSGSAVIGSKWR